VGLRPHQNRSAQLWTPLDTPFETPRTVSRIANPPLGHVTAGSGGPTSSAGRNGVGAPVSETRRLRLLHEIAGVLSSTLDLRSLYDTIYDQISRVMDTSMFFVALAPSRGSTVTIPYVREFGHLTLDIEAPEAHSVTTHVFERGRTLLFHTAEQYEQFAENNGLPIIIMGDESRGPSEAMIYAPLNTGSRTIGTLSVQSTRRYAYTKDDVETLNVIATQAAIAIQNARLFAESQASAHRRQALLRVAETVNSALELSGVIDAILSGIREVMPYHLAAIQVPNWRTGVLDTVAAIGALEDTRREELKVPFGKGVTGMVFTTGQPLVVRDVRTFEGYIPGSDAVLSEVAVPLRRGHQVVGVLNVERDELDAFSSDEVELLTLFGTQAAIAIENARLFEEQKSRVQELQAVHGLVQEMTSLHDSVAIATAMERGLASLIGFDGCRVYLRDGNRLEPLLIPALRADDPIPRTPRELNEGIPGWVLEHGRSALVESSLSDPRVSNDVREMGVEVSAVATPLLHNEQVAGVICLWKRGADGFTRDDLRVLEIIAAQAAIGFDRSRLYDEMRLQARTDELTGLFNRRYLAERMTEELSRAVRNGHPLAMVMVDADEFKNVNDLFGHDAGDAVLRSLAHLMRSEVRTEDLVVRYGGEEFLLLLPEVSAEGAAIVAERLRALIATADLGGETGVGHIEVSVGVAELEPGDTGEEIITRADRGMYHAKRNGGNQVCICRNGECLIPSVDPVEDEPAA